MDLNHNGCVDVLTEFWILFQLCLEGDNSTIFAVTFLGSQPRNRFSFYREVEIQNEFLLLYSTILKTAIFEYLNFKSIFIFLSLWSQITLWVKRIYSFHEYLQMWSFQFYDASYNTADISTRRLLFSISFKAGNLVSSSNTTNLHNLLIRFWIVTLYIVELEWFTNTIHVVSSGKSYLLFRCL